MIVRMFWIVQPVSMIARMCYELPKTFPWLWGCVEVLICFSSPGWFRIPLVCFGALAETLAGDLGWLLKVQLNLLWFQWRYSPTSLKHLKTKSLQGIFARVVRITYTNQTSRLSEIWPWMKFIAVWGDGIFGVPRSDYDQVEIRIPTSKTAGLCSFSWLLQGDAQVGSRFFCWFITRTK
jgi:hypothetical protein